MRRMRMRGRQHLQPQRRITLGGKQCLQARSLFAGIGRRLMGGGMIDEVEQFAAVPRF